LTVAEAAEMILIGIGGNLESPEYGSPRKTLGAALAALETDGISILARSSWYRSEPIPRSSQPWFVNAIVSIATALGPKKLLAALQSIETRFGRVRSEPNAARVLDLDLIDYQGKVMRTPSLVLPHPRLHQRRFVLAPVVEIAPGWRHPLSGLTAEQLLGQLSDEQPVERLPC
jgi:2-amino-4-hydroxy-6-hydroxymethyldihydropteridine diphosphokinase